jgi:hypothetical protein
MARCSQERRTGTTSDPEWRAGAARENCVSGGAGGVSPMQTAPNGGPGPWTRPSRERVGARSAGREDPVFAAWLARPVETPGTWLARGTDDRVGVAGADSDDGGGFGPRTASSMEPPSAGVSAPDGTAHPRVYRADGWHGDGCFVSKRSASWSSEHGTGSQRVRRVRSLVAEGKPRRKAGADQKPHEWQRSRRPQRGRGENRRGSEKLRGRNVPGEASPGEADPVADVAEGAPNPTRGTGDIGLRSAVRLVP